MIQVYTGEGKGKTTASVGLAVRASAHYPVLFLQFLKDGSSSEVGTLEKIDQITVKHFGSGSRIYPGKANVREQELAKEALEWLSQNKQNYQVVILDEAVTAVQLGILDEGGLFQAIQDEDTSREYILTGHGASKNLIAAADLVTEMKPIKHYYDKGVAARRGIEY